MTTINRIRVWGALALTLAFAMVACGDPGPILPGGGGTGVERTTTGIGPISGFGSVIVNGVRYDDANAQISDDRGAILQRADLKLGMMVVIQGSIELGESTGRAHTIEVFSALNGPIDEVFQDGIEINGITARIASTTVIAGAQTLERGKFARVYGAFDAANMLVVATRIEMDDTNELRLTGSVSNWDPANNEFSIDQVRIAYDDNLLPAGFRNGAGVRLRLDAASADQVARATQIQLIDTATALSGELVSLSGVVAQVPAPSNFVVDGQLVNGSAAQYGGGAIEDVVPGTVIRVTGIIVDDTLNATSIDIESTPNVGVGVPPEIQLTGPIENFNGVAGFSVRGEAVDASLALGNANDYQVQLGNGVCVSVFGQLSVGPDGSSIVRATRIDFPGADCHDTGTTEALANPVASISPDDPEGTGADNADVVAVAHQGSDSGQDAASGEDSDLATNLKADQEDDPASVTEVDEAVVTVDPVKVEETAKEESKLAELLRKVAEYVEKLKLELAEKKRKETEKEAKEAQEQAEKARKEAEKEAKEQAEKERKEAEKLEKEAQEQAEKERKEAEKEAKEAEELAEKARKEAEEEAKKLAEAEREAAEKERKEAEKEAKEAEELAEKARKEAEEEAKKLAEAEREAAEKERKEAEKEAKEARERAEKERKEAEKLEKEAAKRAEKERKEAEKLEKEAAKQAEKERKEAEKDAKKRAK